MVFIIACFFLHRNKNLQVIKNFDEIVERVKGFPEPMRVIVAAAQDEHTLQAIKHAQEEGIAKPVLVGDKAEINKICAEIGLVVPEEDIYDVPDVDESAKRAVALIHEGKGDFLMKGKMETAQILKPAVNKETGLGTGRVMSHFVFDELPHYHKLLVTTDGGMMTYPTLEQKAQIIENTVETLKALGYENPKIAAVATGLSKPLMSAHSLSRAISREIGPSTTQSLISPRSFISFNSRASTVSGKIGRASCRERV